MIHPVDYKPSQDFGANPTKHLPVGHPIIQTFGNYQPDGHTGVDYPCSIGTPVKAAAAGTVVHVGRFGGSYASNPWWIQPSFAGYTYVVDHGHFIGIYGHCMDGAARVSAGQRVAEGQVLGLSGNTGASTGPHLHFECLPAKFNLNSAYYGRINPASLFGGIQVHGTTTTPPSEEDDMFSDDDRAALVAARNEATNAKNNAAEATRVATDARNEATNAKNYAIAAIQAAESLLQTQLPDPNETGRSYSLAEWIVYGNLKAGGAQQVASSLTPELIAAAVAKASSGVDAQAIADRLQVTVKEG